MKIESKELELVAVAKLKHYEKNANKHTPEQIKRLIKVFKYQGFRVPLIVDRSTDEVIAGNARLEAARELKLKEVPVIYQTFKDEAQRYSFMVSDNALNDWSKLDMADINLSIEAFKDFDLEMLGLQEHLNSLDAETVNRGDENSEWVGMPNFEKGEDYIKLTFIFKSQKDREKYVDRHKIDVNLKQKTTWIVYV